jgi:hypothetical protein
MAEGSEQERDRPDRDDDVVTETAEGGSVITRRRRPRLLPSPAHTRSLAGRAAFAVDWQLP